MTQQQTFFSDDELERNGNAWKDELNLAEFPTSLLYRPRDPSIKTIEFKDVILDSKSGENIERKVTVIGSDKFGLTNSFDDEVILALMQLSALERFASKTLEISTRRIAEVLGLSINGKNIKKIKESIKRWHGVSIEYKQAWRNKKKQTNDTLGFHLIEEYYFREEQLDAHGKSYIRWGAKIYDSFRSGNLKSLDLLTYRRLRRPTSKRLYRFLDKRFYNTNHVTFDLHEFARNKIGLDTEVDSASLKRSLWSGLEELMKIGYLVTKTKEETFNRQRYGKFTVRCTRAEHNSLPVIDLNSNDDLSAMLITFGITKSMAKKLVEQHDADYILGKIDEFEFTLEQLSGRGKETDRMSNPAGYLVESIRQKYAPPKGYKPKAEREEAIAEKLKERNALIRNASEADRERERLKQQELEDERQLLDRFFEGKHEKEIKVFYQEVKEREIYTGNKMVDSPGSFGDAALELAVIQRIKEIVGE